MGAAIVLSGTASLVTRASAESAPSAAPKADSATLPAGHDAAAIQGMVDALAARLKQDGSDADGWVRLIRSYKVLGDSAKADAAAADAQRALAGDPAKLQQFNAALSESGGDNAAASSHTAAADAPPGEHGHGATIESMVERLAQRLKTSGSDPAGWLMLVRSYATLGEKDKATAAIGDARQALAGDPDKAEQFNKALATFNIGQ